MNAKTCMNQSVAEHTSLRPALLCVLTLCLLASACAPMAPRSPASGVLNQRIPGSQPGPGDGTPAESQPITTPLISSKSIADGLNEAASMRMDFAASGRFHSGKAVESQASVWIDASAERFLPEGKDVSLTIKDATLAQVVWILGRDAGINLVLDESALGLTQKSSFHLIGVTSKDALLAVLRTFDVFASADSAAAVVVRADVSKTFSIDPNLSAGALSSVVGGDLLGSAKDATGVSASAKSTNAFGNRAKDAFEHLMPLLVGILGKSDEAGKNAQRPEPYVGADQGKGVVYVRGRPSRVREIEVMLSRLNEEHGKQFSVDAQLVSISLFDQYRLGLDWNFVSQHVAGTIGASSVSPQKAVGNSGFISQVFQFFGDQVAGGNFGNGGAGLAYQNNKLTATVNALQLFGETKVISSPSLAIKSGSSASLLVGDSIRYVQSVTVKSTPSLTGTTTETSLATDSIFDGVSFNVGGRVSEDGFIDLFVAPTRSSVDRTSLQLIAIGTGQVTLPRTSVSAASSWLRVRPGSIIVIGGLKGVLKTSTESGIPGLAGRGGLSRLFGVTNDFNETSELVVVIKADLLQ